MLRKFALGLSPRRECWRMRWASFSSARLQTFLVDETISLEVWLAPYPLYFNFCSRRRLSHLYLGMDRQSHLSIRGLGGAGEGFLTLVFLLNLWHSDGGA